VPTPQQAMLCDVDSSSSVTVLDALQMAQEAAGLPTALMCPGSPPEAQNCAAPAMATGEVLLTYDLLDAQSDSCDLTLDYSTDMGVTFAVASPGLGGDGLSALSSDPTGVAHVVSWDSDSDLPLMTVPAVRLRVTPSDSTGVGVACESADFALDNSPPPLNTALVLYDGSGTLSFGMTAGVELRTDLQNDGFTVDLMSALPASLTPYEIIYDIRFTVTPTPADIAAFTSFAALGRGICFAVGWSTSNPRAQAFQDWLNVDLGAGGAVFTNVGGYSGQTITADMGHPIWSVPNAIALLDPLESNCVHTIASPGSGVIFIAGSTYRMGAFWDSPALSSSPGRVVGLFFANFVCLTNTVGELLLENLSEFLR